MGWLGSLPMIQIWAPLDARTNAEIALLANLISLTPGTLSLDVTDDGKTLYVAETYTCKLWAYDIAAPGEIAFSQGLLGPGGTFLYSPSGYTFFDSLAVDGAGNICVATIGQSGISVVSPEGELVEFVATDDPFTTNICFGGPDLKTAYITLSGTGRLVKMDWPRGGAKLNYLNA